MNRRARTATRRRAFAEIVGGDLQVVGDALSTSRERFVALRDLHPSASSSKQWSDKQD
jgi:hypothetical protein